MSREKHFSTGCFEQQLNFYCRRTKTARQNNAPYGIYVVVSFYYNVVKNGISRRRKAAEKFHFFASCGTVNESERRRRERVHHYMKNCCFCTAFNI